MTAQPQGAVLNVDNPPPVVVISAGLPPTTIMGENVAFTAVESVTITGLLVGLVTGATFNFAANVEAIGQGLEQTVGNLAVVAGPPVGGTITVNANIPCGGLPAGTYILTVSFTSTSGGVPNGIAGFEQVMIQAAPGA